MRWAIALVGGLGSFTASEGRAQTINVVSATEKVYEGDSALPNPTASATIFAAQNEFEGFQIVVTGPATNVSVTASTLTGPGGFQILPSTSGQRGNIMVYREAFLNIPAGSQTDPSAKPGSVPDALVPQFDEFYQEARNATVSSVLSGKNAVFFVDVQVPPDATPGVYNGSVTVDYNGTSSAVQVALTVWPFSLPSTPTLRSYFRHNWNTAFSQYPSLNQTCCNDAVAAMHVRHAVLALNHRVTFHTMDDGLGVAGDNFAHYDQFFGPLLSGTANTLLSGAHVTVVEVLGNDRQGWANHFNQGQPLANHWPDLVYDYAADEPGNVSTWCALATNSTADANAGVRATTTTDMASTQRPGAVCNNQPIDISKISVFIPNVTQVQTSSMGTGQNSLADYSSWKTAGKEIWEYQSCNTWGCAPLGTAGNAATGYPSYNLDHSAIRNRAMQWVTFRNGLTGELYYSAGWHWTQDGADPWTSQVAFGGNGAGTLFYPGIASAGHTGSIGGTHDIPIASLRLKMIREGVEDYEYMAILKGLGDEGYADSEIDAVFPTAHSTDTATTTAMYAARSNLACRIITLQHPTWSCTDPGTWGSAPPTFAAAVTKSGTGTGTVMSSPAGIDCGATCSASFADGTAVTLTAIPSSGSSFGGFSGGCGSSSTTCAFTISAATTVDAAFAVNDFSMTLNPTSASAAQGASADYSVSTALVSGAAQTVTFSTSGLPAGTSASFNPASVTAGGSSTMTVSVGSSTPAGTYSFSVVGTGAATTKTSGATLVVTPPSSIAFRAKSTFFMRSTSTRSINLAVPAGVQPDDVLIANVFAGDYPGSALPTINAPSGWQLLRTVRHGTAALLKIYSRVATATDPGKTYSWTTNMWVGSASSLLAYSGANAAAPVDVTAGQDNPSAATTFSTPAVTTSAVGDLLIAIYAAYSNVRPPTTGWSTPTGMTQRVFLNNDDGSGTGALLSLSNDDKIQAVAGASGTFRSTATPGQNYALTALVALKR